jgi:hypothetical protein
MQPITKDLNERLARQGDLHAPTKFSKSKEPVVQSGNCSSLDNLHDICLCLSMSSSQEMEQEWNFSRKDRSYDDIRALLFGVASREQFRMTRRNTARSPTIL